MEYGAHLPLLSFQGESRKLADLEAFTDAARELGYTFLCANDHLVFSRAWLDGPTALSAVMSRSGGMKLATTICLPVVRGPGPTAKWLAALDVLSNGRVVAGVGPGSSARDYALVGLSYDERWARLEESIHTMRAMFSGGTFEGEYYSTNEEQFEPLPVQKGGPPVWMGSWGGDVPRRVDHRVEIEAAVSLGKRSSGDLLLFVNAVDPFSVSVQGIDQDRHALVAA